MRTKLLILTSAGLAIILGCVQTTSVEAPSEVNQNTTFTATTNVIASYSSLASSTTCCLAILIPEIWTLDRVYGYGEGAGFSGPLDTMGAHGNPPWQHPAPSGYLWSCWETPAPILADSGETGYADALISVTDSLGIYQLAFCAGLYNPIEDVNWEDYPCSCTVEVTLLNLEQETWGSIKSKLGEQE